MNTNNMCVGLVVKNYKEMCCLLNENIKGGDSKKSQLKEWERYIKYHKDGNKFIVDEIYDSPLPKEDNRQDGNNSLYSKYIQKLILDLLSQDENCGQVFLSCNQLLRKLQMVSQNYAKGRRDIPKLSEILKVDEDIVEDIYSYTHSKLKSALEGALNSLAKQSWIMWHKKKTVCIKEVIPKINDLGTYVLDKHNNIVYDNIIIQYREASLSECQIILKYEGELLDKLGCKNKQELIIKNKMDYFRQEMNKSLSDCNILFYYDSYEIITHKDALIERLGRFEKANTYEQLNDTIIEQTYKSIETKHQNACDKTKCDFGRKPFENKTDEIRASEKYVDMSKLISDKILPRKARKINGL